MKKINIKDKFRSKKKLNDPNIFEGSDEEKKKLTRLSVWYQAFILVLTSFLRALSMNMFAVPNKIAPGGVAGISSILYNALGWNAALTSFLFNIPLLILSFFFINKQFAVLTTIAIAATSGAMELLNLTSLPVFVGDPFAAAIMAGILNGVALALLLSINSSSGGSDIVALLVQNKAPQIKTVWLMFILNALVALAAGIAFGSMSIVIYSIVSIYVGSYVAELLQKGFISTIEFKIFTSKEEEISRFVIEKLHHGVTHITGKGMYTGQEVNHLVCIVRKRQEVMLARYIKEVDPSAFYYTCTVREVVGKGFDNTISPDSKL